jgi:ATP-binding cassette, subfamily G (WHITE), member 2, PDR
MPFAIPQHEGVDTLINGVRLQRIASYGRNYVDEGLEPIENQQQRDDEIRRLASTVSNQTPGTNPFLASPGGPLDPMGPNFNATAWMKAFYTMCLDESATNSRSRGLAFRHLSVHGYGSPTDFQKTVGNIFLNIIPTASKLLGQKGTKIQILRDFEGVLDSGELLCVLGPPGSGCSTLLKTIAGETHGLHLGKESYLNYKGVSSEEMSTRFRGEATYTAEDDSHLPMLSVGDTLQFAALARSPRILPSGMSRESFAQHLAAVVMAAFGISHTRNTRVGDNVRQSLSPKPYTDLS